MHSIMKSYLKTILIVLIVLLALPLLTAAAETPATVKYETGFYYTVQKGDTLWDLSQKFSDTPWQWPEMWQENDQIANPHRIYPGERIRLYRRRDAGAYGQGQAGQEGNDKSGDATSEKSEKKGLGENSDLDGLLFFEYASIDRVGFIREEPALSHGSIFKVEGQKEMISIDDLVYIQPRPNFTLSPGDRYTLYRTLKPIRDRNTNKYIGIQHYFTGAVEILIKRPKFVLARVVGAYRPIKLGDKLMPYKHNLPQIKLHPSPPGLEGNIIESEEHHGIFGENSIAFINKGKREGVEPGQLYWVFKQEKYQINSDKESEVLLTPVLLGEVLVLLAENTTATVMITDSRNAMQAGDRIITPFKLE